MRRSLSAFAVATLVVTGLLHAQDPGTAGGRAPNIVKRDRVDLSGQWEVADGSGHGVLGKSFTAKQNADSLTLETQTTEYSSQNGVGVTTLGPMKRRTYAFDGAETRESFPVPARFADVDPRRISAFYTSSVSTRAAWMGDLLVVVSHYTMRNNTPKRVPSEFDSEQTVRLTLTRDAAGILTAERIVITDPDQDTHVRIDVPSVSKTVYKKTT